MRSNEALETLVSWCIRDCLSTSADNRVLSRFEVRGEKGFAKFAILHRERFVVDCRSHGVIGDVLFCVVTDDVWVLNFL